MNPGALGRQDHAHTCVLFIKKERKVYGKIICKKNCFQNIHNIFLSLLK